MADFSVRSDSVNVEQVMEQIRARIREKRGVDYTEQQIRELAAVKLEKFLDPRGVRSDLLDQFRKAQPAYQPPELPNFAFEEATLFETHRAPIRWLRKLLLPILKLFFNPNPLIQALHIQSQLNTMNAEREARREAERRQLDQLYYELIHNLVLETTRLGIDVKNLKMRLESVSSRLEFNERRARALESVVVYKPAGGEERPPRQERTDRTDRPARPHQQQQPPPPQQQLPQRQYTPPAQLPVSGGAPTAVAASADTAGAPIAVPPPAAGAASAAAGEGPGQRSRRRRRRRGRRGGGSAAALMGASAAQAGQPADGSSDAPASDDEMNEPLDDGSDDDGADDRQSAAPAANAAPAPAIGDRPSAPSPQPSAPAVTRDADAPREEGHAPPTAPGHGDTDPQ
jgi:hypothetical protein